MNTASPVETPDKDKSHLRTLSICHYVYGALMALSLLGVWGHYYLMNFIMKMEAQDGGETMPDEFMGMMRGFYAIAAFLLILIAVLNFLAGRFLKQTTNRIFVFVVAGLNCLNMPLGTTLGVFTIIVLMRPSVTERFAHNLEFREAS